MENSIILEFRFRADTTPRMDRDYVLLQQLDIRFTIMIFLPQIIYET